MSLQSCNQWKTLYYICGYCYWIKCWFINLLILIWYIWHVWFENIETIGKILHLFLFIMLYSICCIHYVVFIMLYSLCCIQYVVFIMLYSICCIHYVVFIMLYSICAFVSTHIQYSTEHYCLVRLHKTENTIN